MLEERILADRVRSAQPRAPATEELTMQVGLTDPSRRPAESTASNRGRGDLAKNFDKFSDVMHQLASRPPGGLVSGTPRPGLLAIGPTEPLAERGCGVGRGEAGAAELGAPRIAEIGDAEELADEAGRDPGDRFEVDPLEVHLSSPAANLAPQQAESPQRASAWVDQLACELVRAVAWGGDRRRGAARLELGGARFGGTRVTIRADADGLTVELDAPPQVDAAELAVRLRERLEKRGLLVRSVTER